MRLTSILVLSACLHLSARTTAQRISLSEHHSSLEKVFREIKKQTGYLFVYRDEWLRETGKVDIDIRNANLKEVLDLCFSNQPFTYVVIDKMVVLKQKPPALELPQLWDPLAPPVPIDVHGRVTDDKGNPLVGATVLVRGKKASGGRVRVQSVTVQGTATAAPVAITSATADTAMVSTATDSASTPLIASGLRGIELSRATAEPGSVTGEPLNIVYVTVTDANGEFNLPGVSENSTIVISNVGYETQEIKVTKKKDISVRLSVKASQLQNLEVTYSNGYQVLSKERATGSYGKADMEIFKNRASTQDLMGRLEGQIPGLTVNVSPSALTSNLNGNGKGSQSALIRGKSTLELGSEPLYILNGVPVSDWADINPDDISDITVLKDAAAAAIWGARAANGVIVVTTRAGKRDTKIKVDYSGYINFQGKPDFGYVPVLNSKQYIQAAKETFDPIAHPWSSLTFDYIAPHELILYNQYRGLITAAQANASLDSLANINSLDQVKNIWFRNGLTTNHTLSMSGGNSIYAFYSSLSYTDIQSQTPGEKNNTYRVNFTQDFNPSKNIRISLATNLTNTISSRQNPITIDNHALPYQLFKDAQGNSLNMNYKNYWSDSLRLDYQARSRVNLDYNPIDEMKYGHARVNNLGINVTGNVNIHLWKGLSYLGTYGYATQPGKYFTYEDHRTLRMRQQLVSLTVAPTTADVPVYYFPTTGGKYNNVTNEQRNWTSRNQLTYIAKPRKGNDDLSIQVGQEAREDYYSNNSITLEGYDEALQTYAVLDYKTLSQGVYNTVTGSGGYYNSPFQTIEHMTRFTSYFALTNYTFGHKYSLDLSWRQDHSNLFGVEKSSQNRPIWSMGGKWQIARENFMKPLKWVDDLAIRATYGITGNSPNVGTASSQDILGAAYAYPPAISGPALVVGTAANRTINWETTQTYNIGIDFALLKRRISGGIDLYQKDTKDLIGSKDLNPFTGSARGTGNLGHLVNKGVELSLQTENITGKDFGWSTHFVFSWNKSKLLSYSSVPSYNLTDYGKLYSSYWVGYSVGPLFAYKWAGLDGMGDPQVMLADKTVTKALNVVKESDMVYKGTIIPVFNGGLTNTFRYKGVQLSANLVYSLGNVMRRDVNQFYTGRLTVGADWNSNISAEFLKRWQKPGDEKITDVPSYVSDYTSYSRRNKDYYTNADINVVSASYAKIRDITLSYTLPRSLVQMAKIDRVSVYVQATNFMIWKANKYGIDPELQGMLYGYRAERNVNHTYSIGANVSF